MYEQVVHHTKNPRRTAVVPAGVVAEGLGKRFGDLWALRDLDLDVAARHRARPARPQRRRQDHGDPHPHHPVAPDRGLAPRVAGFDVVAEPDEVRRRIGVAAQQATVDGLLTARLNLEMVGRLHHLPKREAERRGRRAARAARPRPTPRPRS